MARSCSIGMRMAIWDIENEEEKTALKASLLGIFVRLAVICCNSHAMMKIGAQLIHDLEYVLVNYHL